MTSPPSAHGDSGNWSQGICPATLFLKISLRPSSSTPQLSTNQFSVFTPCRG
jgi:hypothetical protein